MPEWRNGLRARLKIVWPQGRVGSSPTSGIFYKLSTSQDGKRCYPLSYVQENFFGCFFNNTYCEREFFSTHG